MAEPKTNAELTEIWIEGQIIASDLIKHEEGFSKLLGNALKCADPYNAAQIKHAFPEYWKEEEIEEIEEEWTEGQIVGELMVKYGGSFVNRLGLAILYTDIHTQKRIKQAFQRYWDKYMKISKDMENQKGQENQEE